MQLLATLVLFCILPLGTLSIPFRRDGPPLNPSVNTSDIFLAPPGPPSIYPRLTKLADGSILGGYTETNGLHRALKVTRSIDGGMTFSPWGLVAQSDDNDLDNIELIQLPDKSILAGCRNHIRGATATSYALYRLQVFISTDNGKSWNFLSNIDTRVPKGVNGLWEPFFRMATSGALQVYYSAENEAQDQDILMKTSFDCGVTWQNQTTVAGATTLGRDGMPGCVDFNDNGVQSVICVFETTEGGDGLFKIKKVISSDDGQTWGDRDFVYNPTGGNNAGAPQVVRTTDGTLVVSFVTDEDTSLHQWANGADAKIVTGDCTDPACWGRKTTFSGVESTFPGLFTLDDGRILGCAQSQYSRAICHSISFSG